MFKQRWLRIVALMIIQVFAFSNFALAHPNLEFISKGEDELRVAAFAEERQSQKEISEKLDRNKASDHEFRDGEIISSHTITENWQIQRFPKDKRVIFAEVRFYSDGDLIGEGRLEFYRQGVSIDTCKFKSYHEGQKLAEEFVVRMYIGAQEISQLLDLNVKWAHCYHYLSHTEESREEYLPPERWYINSETCKRIYSVFKHLGMEPLKNRVDYELVPPHIRKEICRVSAVYSEHIMELNELIRRAKENWRDWFYKNRIRTAYEGEDFKTYWENLKINSDWKKILQERKRNERKAKQQIYEQVGKIQDREKNAQMWAKIFPYANVQLNKENLTESMAFIIAPALIGDNPGMALAIQNLKEQLGDKIRIVLQHSQKSEDLGAEALYEAIKEVTDGAIDLKGKVNLEVSAKMKPEEIIGEIQRKYTEIKSIRAIGREEWAKGFENIERSGLEEITLVFCKIGEGNQAAQGDLAVLLGLKDTGVLPEAEMKELNRRWGKGGNFFIVETREVSEAAEIEKYQEALKEFN